MCWDSPAPGDEEWVIGSCAAPRSLEDVDAADRVEHGSRGRVPDPFAADVLRLALSRCRGLHGYDWRSAAG
jgi:hypothetical protein